MYIYIYCIYIYMLIICIYTYICLLYIWLYLIISEGAASLLEHHLQDFWVDFCHDVEPLKGFAVDFPSTPSLGLAASCKDEQLRVRLKMAFCMERSMVNQWILGYHVLSITLQMLIIPKMLSWVSPQKTSSTKTTWLWARGYPVACTLPSM